MLNVLRLFFSLRPLWAGLLILVGLGLLAPALAQVNISGKPGLLYIPSARVLDEGTFHIGYAFAPRDYSFRFTHKNSESIAFANLVLLPRFEININLLNPNGPIRFGDKGIGDRQIDFKYAFLTEKGNRPSAALILSAPFGIDNSLVTYALVATKNYQLSSVLRLEVTAGTGSPWYIYRDEKNDQNRNILEGFAFKKKGNNNRQKYLTGPFAGAILRIRERAGLMAEWDSQQVNVGAYATLWKRWTLQAGLLDGRQLTFGTSYAVSLLSPPKPALPHETH